MDSNYKKYLKYKIKYLLGGSEQPQISHRIVPTGVDPTTLNTYRIHPNNWDTWNRILIPGNYVLDLENSLPPIPDSIENSLPNLNQLIELISPIPEERDIIPPQPPIFRREDEVVPERDLQEARERARASISDRINQRIGQLLNPRAALLAQEEREREREREEKEREERTK
jgi:hypothetical protein